MNKKLIAILLLGTMIMLFLPAVISAEKTITLTLDGEYPYDSFPGTKLKAVSETVLEGEEKIFYYLNGNKVGESSEAGEFVFESVAGENILTAEVVDASDVPLCTSEPIKLELARYTLLEGKRYPLDFENGKFNSADFYEYSYWNKGYTPEIVTDEDTGSYVMKVSITGKSYAGWELRYPGSGLSNAFTGGWAVYEYDVKFANFNGGNVRLFFIKTSGGGELVAGGPAQNTGATTWAPDGKFETDKWYNVKCVVNLDEKTADVYVDGIPVLTDIVLSDKFSNIMYYNLPRFMAFSDTLDSTYYIDNIVVSNYAQTFDVTAFTDTQEGRVDGIDNFPLEGASAILKFSEKMATMYKNNFIFTVDGRSVDFEFEYDADSKEAKITPAISFNGREKCKITYIGLKTSQELGAKGDTFIEFSVGAPKYGIASITHSGITADENCEVMINVNNVTDKDEESIVLLGLYDNNALLSVNAVAVKVLAGNEEDIPLTISIPNNYEGENHHLCAYLMSADTYFKIDLLQD